MVLPECEGDADGDGVRVTRLAGPSARDWVVTWDGAYFATPARQGLSVNAQGEIFLAYSLYDATLQSTTALLRKLDAQGDALWTRHWRMGRSVHGQEPMALVALADGGALLAGTSLRTEAACQGAQSAGGCVDAFIVRFDAHGAERWTLTFGNIEHSDAVMGLALSQDRVAYATGQVTGGVRFANGTLLQSHGSVDHFVLALDLDLCEVRWAHAFGTSAQEMEGPAVTALPDGLAVGPIANSDGSVLRLGRDGSLRFAVSPVPATRGVFAAAPGGQLWVSGLSYTKVSAPAESTTQLVQLGADGGVRASYTLRSPIGGIYVLPHLFSLADGRTLTAGTYGMEPLGSATRDKVHEVLELGNGEPRSLVSFRLWDTAGGAALSRDGALLEAGTFIKSSTFGLGEQELHADGSAVYLLQRAL